MEQLTEVLATFLLVYIAFWKKDTFLYFLSCPVIVTYGLGWYNSYETSAGFTLALALFGLGLYTFILGVLHLIGRI